MAKAKLNRQLKKPFFATCVWQNRIELGVVLNNIGLHKIIQAIHHLKTEVPKATGHFSTSVTSSVNQIDEIKLFIPFSGVNL